MKRKILVGVLILLVVVESTILGLILMWPQGPVPQGAPTTRPEGDDWIDLLDAQHASGWANVSDDRDIFEIADGALHIYGTFGRLRYVAYTTETFADFDLHIEFKVTPRANSGLFLRVPKGESPFRGFEIQVLDDHGKPPNAHRSGAVYDVVTPMHNLSRPTGQWNAYDVTLRDRTVTVRMNGWLVLQSDFSKMTTPLGKFAAPYAKMPLEGMISLQDHGGEVWYRNILLRSHQGGL